jgi:hypothetical protein
MQSIEVLFHFYRMDRLERHAREIGIRSYVRPSADTVCCLICARCEEKSKDICYILLEREGHGRRSTDLLASI